MAKSFSMESLNAAQRKAVQTLQGPVLILAGAGTGKTRTVTCRIAYMVDRGISPKSILAVTFTNKAALEMRERVGQMVERKAARQIMVSTFHSLCVRILREDIGRLGYKTNFTIYSGSEQSGLIRRLIVRHGGITEKITPKDVLSSMSRMKNSGLGLDSIEDNLTANIAASYQRELQAQNSVDFDDLLILADKLLKEHRDVREAWQQRFRYITVDEFQDTNSLQMSLLGHLVGPEHNVCVVGDDDQSIYGWRGAQISNILEFERFFPNPSVIKLEENYRCTAPILDTANALIRHNLGRRDKTLRAHKGGGEAVRLISMPGDAEEAEFIITDIENVRRQEGRPWEDFAILFRANTQSRIIEQTLREHKIPYRMVGAQSFFDRKEVKDLISYLATIENPQADEYLLRILNTPPRGISELTSHLAIDWSREHGNSVWAALQDEEFLATLSTRARNNVQAFNELIAKYIDLFQDKETDFGDILEQLIEETGFSEYVTRLCKTEAEIQKRLVSIGDRLRPGAGGEKGHGEPGPHRKRAGIEVQHSGLFGAGPGGRHPVRVPERDRPVHGSRQRGGGGRLRHHDDHARRQGTGISGSVPRGAGGRHSSPQAFPGRRQLRRRTPPALRRHHARPGETHAYLLRHAPALRGPHALPALLLPQ